MGIIISIVSVIMFAIEIGAISFIVQSICLNIGIEFNFPLTVIIISIANLFLLRKLFTGDNNKY